MTKVWKWYLDKVVGIRNSLLEPVRAAPLLAVALFWLMAVLLTCKKIVISAVLTYRPATCSVSTC